MHFGRLVSHRIVTAVLALAFFSCASDRYVGSIGRSGNYANRGYGLVIALGQQDLLKRWTAIDPKQVSEFPEALQPKAKEAAIDLNGDGFIHHDELVFQWSPNLRLFNKERPKTQIEVAVEILGGKNQSSNFSAYARHFLKTEFSRDSTAKDWTSRQISPSYPAFITAFQNPATHIAIIDHPKFNAEDGATRRQIILVRLSGEKLDAIDQKDFELFLDAITLNKKAGRQTSLEQY